MFNRKLLHIDSLKWYKIFRFVFVFLLSIHLMAFISVRADTHSSPDFNTLFKKVSPAVVNISTLSKPKKRKLAKIKSLEELGIPEIFRPYFYSEPDTSNDQPQPLSLGSGFIISKDGYILTNNHVVEGADIIVVRLNDRSEMNAKLIGSDRRSDIALLKIEAKRDLPTVKMGDSSLLETGQWVAAIGSPFDFEYSITKGIVSAKNRILQNDLYIPFIQTDVPINPGNSGGPLLNLEGEVIGINSQIFTRSGGFMGLSFAIPSNHVSWVVKQIKDKGRVSRGWLGVVIQRVSRDLAESFGLKKPIGALISFLVSGGPAKRAGLHIGDIVTKLDDHVILDSNYLPILVGVLEPNTKVRLEVMRQGKPIIISAKIGKLPEKGDLMSDKKIRNTNNPLGISVETLDSKLRRKLDVDDGVEGVVITHVQSQGLGRNLQLQAGDVISHLDNQLVPDMKKFNTVVGKLPKKRSIAMRVIRNGQAIYISFRLMH